MPKREKPSGIKSKCMACGDEFECVSASFAPICNDCRKHHEDSEKKVRK